jgi:hypothetical protein
MNLEKVKIRAEKGIPKFLPSGGRASALGRWSPVFRLGGAPGGADLFKIDFLNNVVLSFPAKDLLLQ